MLLPGAGFGGTDPRVRADLVFYETGHGGAVVSVGSIAWCSQLDRDGDVTRLTTNALRRMLAPEPFDLPSPTLAAAP
jgi:N,N-dimethylformamidase